MLFVHSRRKATWEEELGPFPPFRLEIPGRVYECRGTPPTHGAAYRYDDLDVMVCYPIPFNVIVSAWRAFCWHMRFPPWRFFETKQERAARHGWNVGYEAAFNVIRGGRRSGCDWDHATPPKRFFP